MLVFDAGCVGVALQGGSEGGLLLAPKERGSGGVVKLAGLLLFVLDGDVGLGDATGNVG